MTKYYLIGIIITDIITSLLMIVILIGCIPLLFFKKYTKIVQYFSTKKLLFHNYLISKILFSA
jgi:hypothetical protein